MTGRTKKQQAGRSVAKAVTGTVVIALAVVAVGVAAAAAAASLRVPRDAASRPA